MKRFIEETWALNRTIVSDGFNRTLEAIDERIPLTIHAFPTGSMCFDWKLPRKWILREAWIEDEQGRRILDAEDHLLHLVSGSLPVDREVTVDELREHVTCREDRPGAIPYEFKWYELDWGFCMSCEQYESLRDERYRVYIDAEYVDDYLRVGEHVVEGALDNSIILMAHVDHPTQVNDGLIGAAALIELARRMAGRSHRFTWRMMFVPERIGSIAFFANNLDLLPLMTGGIFVEMVGLDYPLALQYSKWADTRLDRVARFVGRRVDSELLEARCWELVVNDDGFLNSPGIDLPMLSISRTRGDNVFHHFPEYHTSDDTPELVNWERVEESVDVLEQIVSIVERDYVPIRTYRGEPHLSRHGLWVDWREQPALSHNINAILHALDNRTSVFDIADDLDVPFEQVFDFIERLRAEGLVEVGPELPWYTRDTPWERLASRESPPEPVLLPRNAD